MIRNKDNLENHPIYDIDTDMGSAMWLLLLFLSLYLLVSLAFQSIAPVDP